MSHSSAVLRPAIKALRGRSLPYSNGSTSKGQKTSGFLHGKSIAAERILRSFNTRAFKREQPDNPDLMLHFISEAITRNEPVSFILYWGKGPRCNVGEPEAKTFNYLTALIGRVRQAYAPGAAVTLICTDTHAELNGHSAQDIRAYFDEVAAAAHQHGFESCWLSQLMHGVDVTPEGDLQHQDVPKEIFSTLCTSAAKWFRGNGTVEEGAVRYYQLNMIEKRAVELVFPGSIFLTFNGSDLRSLLPSRLPIFYMFSLRHGISDKPWFLPSSLAPRDVSSDVPVLAHGT